MTEDTNPLGCEPSGKMGSARPKNQERHVPTIQELSETTKTRSKAGRPKTIKRKIIKASQEGLHDNWTRATFIMREDLLQRLKCHATAEKETLKDVINEAVERFLQEIEIIERGEE